MTPKCQVRNQAQGPTWPPLLGPGSVGSGRQGPDPALTVAGPLAWSLAQGGWAEKETTCYLQTLLAHLGWHTQPRGAPDPTTPQTSPW